MTRYNYFLIDNKLQKEIKESFPGADTIDKGISLKRNPDTIRKTAIKVIQGELESPLVKIEEEWYNTHISIYEITHVLENLDSKLTYLNDKLLRTKDYRTDVKQDTKNKIEKTTSDIRENSDKLIKLDKDINLLESENSWLLNYKGIKTDSVRPEIQNVSEIKLSSELNERLKKYELSLIESENSLVSHNILFSSVLANYIKEIYNNLPDEIKKGIKIDESILNSLSSSDKEAIELKSIQKVLKGKDDILSIIKKYK